MQRHTQRPAARAVVSVLAAAALLVSLMATPASAETHPANTDVKGVLKGGFIALGENKPPTEKNSDHYFPLGEKDEEPSICDKDEEKRSHVFANDIDANGNSNDLKFNFTQGTTGIKGVIFIFFPYEVCATLEVLNAGALVMETNDKDVTVYEPPKENNIGPLVEVQFKIVNQNNGNTLATCSTTPQVRQMVGQWEEAKIVDPEENKEQHDWNLTLKNNKKIQVPAVVAAPGCPAGAADAINDPDDGLGLPRDDGNLKLKFAVHDCPDKDCPEVNPT